MSGRFEGMSDAEWELVEDIFPDKAKKSRGMPAAHPRKVLNSLLLIFVNSCRWHDLPRGGQWASKSASHRWLKTWHSDGRLKELQGRLLGAAQNAGIICWKSGAVDALFPCGKGGGAGVAHGYKGKGVLIHLLVDADGMPLSECLSSENGDERKHVSNLLETVAAKTEKAGSPRKNVRRLAADKGYALRNFLRKKGIQPQISS